MKKYMIVCNWPSEVWEVQELVDGDRNLWKTAYLCSGKKQAGYDEAHAWLKEHDK